MQVANMDPGLSLARLRAWIEPHRQSLAVLGAVALAGLGLAVVHRFLGEIHGREIGAALRAIPPARIVAALALTGLSYTLLTFYDVLALRLIGKKLPYRTAALASFTSYTLSHNLGLALLTGGSARYRVYTAAGLSRSDVARVIATAGLSFWFGVLLATAAALLLHAAPLDMGPLRLPAGSGQAAGAAIALGLAGLVAIGGAGKTLDLFGWQLPLPGGRQAALQMLVATADLAVACAALLVLLPGSHLSMLPTMFLAYALAMVVALLTHVPGGIGVFEAVVIAALPGVPTGALAAALIAYRLIYYWLPLAAAASLLALHEGWRWRQPIERAMGGAQAVLSAVAPALLAALAFAGGFVLLVSGALPAIPERLQVLRAVLPLPFVEASQIAASLAGTGLLLLAPGLYRRLDGAFWLTRALLIAGIAFSLSKGFDYEEALVLGAIALLLQWTRPSFYRRTALTADLLTPSWLAVIALAVAGSAWIGFLSYRHVAYDDQLWWSFAWHGDASRFLRASVAAAVLLAGAGLYRLLAPARAVPADDELIAPPFEVVARAPRTDAFLALTGDKRFLHGPHGSFLMYQVRGDSWIVMGDPVGPEPEWADLVWRLREKVDAAQGRLLFYQISPAAIPLAIDLGLGLVKYGEEARVDLADFALDTPARKPLRYAVRRAGREGASFAVIPAAQVPEAMAELAAVSDAWLRAKGHSEKGFSVGRFDPAYLARFDCAVVRHQGRIVAFANILATTGREELSVDLMRHLPDTPYGTMDFLFAELMCWGKAQGFRAFNLGLAPLSGIADRRLAPIWARASGFVYRHGDAIYGFEGLRLYKQKFAPAWEPRYIAGPSGAAFARALFDLQKLVSRRSAGSA